MSHMLLAEGVLPERVISIGDDAHIEEGRLDYLPRVRVKREDSYGDTLIPHIQKFIDDHRLALNKALEKTILELDQVPEKIVEKSRAIFVDPSSSSAVETISDIRQKSNLMVGSLKSAYQRQIESFIDVLKDRTNRALRTWNQKIESINNFSNLEEKIWRITRELNREIRRNEGEQIEMANRGFENLKRAFEKNITDYALRKTLGKGIDQVIQEYEDNPEYSGLVSGMKRRIARATSVYDEPVYNFCNSGNVLQDIFVHLGTVGFCSGWSLGTHILASKKGEKVRMDNVYFSLGMLGAAAVVGIFIAPIGLFTIAKQYAIGIAKGFAQGMICGTIEKKLIDGGILEAQSWASGSVNSLCKDGFKKIEYGIGRLASKINQAQRSPKLVQNIRRAKKTWSKLKNPKVKFSNIANGFGSQMGELFADFILDNFVS